MIFDIIVRLALSAASLWGLYICVRWGFPQFKSLLPDSCVEVTSSPFTRLFRVPFWYGGVVFYVLTLLAAITGEGWLAFAAVIASVLALLASGYLTIIMVAKLRASCRLCWICHTVNLGIFVVWIIILLHG